jgi:hypothetical protein
VIALDEGDLETALGNARLLHERGARKRLSYLRGLGLWCEARVLLARKAPEQAAERAAAAASVIGLLPGKALLLATLSSAELACGRVEAALAHAQQSAALSDRYGTFPYASAAIACARAEAEAAAGHATEARRVVRDAAAVLRSQAASIDDAALRESYVGRIPENARLLELSRAYGL